MQVVPRIGRDRSPNRSIIPRAALFSLIAGAISLALAQSSEADIYLTNGGGETIFDYTNTGTLVSSRSTGGSPNTLALDSAGNVYVTDTDGGVTKYLTGAPGSMLSTASSSALSTTGTAEFYYGTAFGPGGNLFITTNADNGNSSDIKSFKYTGATGTPAAFTDTDANTSFSVTNTIAVDPTTGNVFIADRYNSAILEYPSTGGSTPIKTFTSGVSNPIDIAVDSLGDLYVSDQNGNIEKINISSSLASPVVTDLTSLEGIAVDSQNDLYYIAEDGNNKGGIFEVNSAGTSLGELFNTGSGEADFIAVPVPEPSGAAGMVLCGVVAAMWLLPRRLRPAGVSVLR